MEIRNHFSLLFSVVIRKQASALGFSARFMQKTFGTFISLID
jgi:hypothetical protein